MKLWRIYTVAKKETKEVRYVGLTTRHVATRWNEHCSTARKGRGSRLHAAIRKYGEEAFTIEHVATCASREAACDVEKMLVAEHNTYRAGYNGTAGGEGVWPKGPASADEREATSKRTKALWANPEMREHLSKAMRKPKRPGFGEEVSERMKGRKWSEERRKAFSEFRKGRKHSPETRAKLGAKNAERNRSPEQRAKVSASRKHVTYSVESRAKISASLKKFNASRKPADGLL